MKTSQKIALCIGLVLLSSSALAQEKKGALEGQPAIRNRYQVRDSRFEVGPSFAIALNRNLRHNILTGIRLGYHINNYFSVGADMAAGFGFNSGLHGELDDSYPTWQEKANDVLQNPANAGLNSDQMAAKVRADKSVLQAAADRQIWDKLNNRLSDVKFAGDVRLAFTPIQGRIGVFSKLFVNYDMYIFAGLGMAYLQNGSDDTNEFGVNPANMSEKIGDPRTPSTWTQTNIAPKTPYFMEHKFAVDDANEGFRVGPAFGVGMHMLFNNFLSLGLEVRNLVFEDNETGSDYTRGLSDTEKTDTEAGQCKSGTTTVPCRYIDSDDRSMIQHWYIGMNFTVWFPFEVGVTR